MAQTQARILVSSQGSSRPLEAPAQTQRFSEKRHFADANRHGSGIRRFSAIGLIPVPENRHLGGSGPGPGRRARSGAPRSAVSRTRAPNGRRSKAPTRPLFSPDAEKSHFPDAKHHNSREVPIPGRTTRSLCTRQNKGRPEGRPSKSGGEARIRTGGQGFAGPCLTTWPLRRMKKAERIRPGMHGAGYGVRTRDLNLGKVARYQLR